MDWSECDFGPYEGDAADYAPEPGHMTDKFDNR
jgi:hypothetical protein